MATKERPLDGHAFQRAGGMIAERGFVDKPLRDVGPRREKARFALSVFRGLVRAVYRIEQWEPVVSDGPNQKRRNRWRFVGPPAAELQHLVGGDVSAYLGRASHNPVRYVNC